jgi:hypothetical protein
MAGVLLEIYFQLSKCYVYFTVTRAPWHRLWVRHLAMYLVVTYRWAFYCTANPLY